MLNENTNDEPVAPETGRLALFLKFLIPSLLGVFLFILPIKIDGKTTMLLGAMADWFTQEFGSFLYQLNFVIYALSAVAGLYYFLFKPNLDGRPVLHGIFYVTPIWLFLRLAGLVVAIIVYFDVGPEVLRLEDTGKALYYDVGVPFVAIIGPACFLMPLLTEFGAMDFFGTMIGPAFRKTFRLPGRSAIDATASFVSASNVGILLTAQQYNRNYYTAREAVTIATSFSVVSMPFAYVIAVTAGISDVFFPWYITAIVGCAMCAAIMARIRPLSAIPDDFKDGMPHPSRQQMVSDRGLLGQSFDSALIAAKNAPPLKDLAKEGFRMFIQQWFAILSAALAIATLTSVIAMYSPIGEWISAPIAYVLEAFDIEKASILAPGFIFGFLDQFVPAIIAQQSTDEVMRFVLAGLSLCQLIFMSETGLVMLSVGLPVTFWQLAHIFLLRTIFLVPVLFGCAMLIYS